ncbi:GntR family transcriptional regulator [Niallia sp.]|uniref:GntR family transcriptional regulator n=1 Tax=Niallia sp. TaxID=2837523 RepID=UPI00289BC90E|nr:GntR family transcriptional regulator [Niallia sp.]
MGRHSKKLMVVEAVKDWVINGRVKPGERIYSEYELSKLFDVSRHTVRLAIGELVDDGWLYREPGVGTFCGEPFASKKGKNRTNGKNIGVMTTYISDYITPSIIRGMESYLTDRGYSLTVVCTENDHAKERLCIRNLLDLKMDGLILEPTKSSQFNPNMDYYLELEERNIPYVMINQFYSQLSPFHLIMDDVKGGYIAAEHLIQLGHERILGIFNSDDLQGVHRMKGFLQAMRTGKLPIVPELVVTFTTEQFNDDFEERLLNTLTNKKNTPTAIVCYNDLVAAAVQKVLQKLNLCIPEDVSLISFDDSSLAESAEIRLTTIAHPKSRMGIDAAKSIIAAVEGNERDLSLEPPIIYEPALIIRSTTDVVKKNRSAVS